MKIAPIVREMKRRVNDFAPLIVHTGQHYDAAMSDSFFADLGIPEPDYHLEVGSASHAIQTAKSMTAFESVVLQEKSDWVLVGGDVNSTIACALVCAKLNVKIAHVEAGLRSRDRTMPEETTTLEIPCLTLRENTERPITISHGTNILVGTNPEKIKRAAFEILSQPKLENKKIPALWDGHAAERICDALLGA